MRQSAAQRWLSYRDAILQSQQPRATIQHQLDACDNELRAVCIESSTRHSGVKGHMFRRRYLTRP